MKSKALWAALILVLSIGFLGLAGANAGYMLAGRPTATGVVDVHVVFSSLAEKLQVEADLNDRLEQLKQEGEDQKKYLQELQNDLDILAPDSPAYKEKLTELEKKLFELQNWGAYQSEMHKREGARQTERLYRKLLDAVGRVAEQNGLDLILFKEKPVNFKGIKQKDINGEITSRKVLWAAPDLDLTDQVTQLMNNEFNNMTQ